MHLFNVSYLVLRLGHIVSFPALLPPFSLAPYRKSNLFTASRDKFGLISALTALRASGSFQYALTFGSRSVFLIGSEPFEAIERCEENFVEPGVKPMEKKTIHRFKKPTLSMSRFFHQKVMNN
jgi:hypothetical protein